MPQVLSGHRQNALWSLRVNEYFGCAKYSKFIPFEDTLNLELAMTIFTGLATVIAVVSAFIARRPYIERRQITVHKLKVYKMTVEKYLVEVGGLDECWKEGVTQLTLRWHPKMHEAYPFTQDDLNELALIDKKGKLYLGNPIVFLPNHIQTWFSQHYSFGMNDGGPVVVYTLPNQTKESLRFLNNMDEMLKDAISELAPNWFQRLMWWIAKSIF